MKPKVVCFCGSTRFIDVMAVKMWEAERDEGVIALGCHLLPDGYVSGEGVPVQASHQAEAEGVREHMDKLHRAKIDMADEVRVINVDGYIGDSTRDDIAYAESQGKPVAYLETV